MFPCPPYNRTKGAAAPLLSLFRHPRRLVCKGNKTQCEKLIDETLATHKHNLQLLMIEVFKTKHSLNPTFARDVFTERNNQHNLGSENHLQLPAAKTTAYGLENF